MEQLETNVNTVLHDYMQPILLRLEILESNLEEIHALKSEVQELIKEQWKMHASLVHRVEKLEAEVATMFVMSLSQIEHVADVKAICDHKKDL